MRIIILSAFSLFFVITLFGQTQFRSGIFLHHSTGLCIWGPNGSSTDIPQEMASYNFTNSYTDSNAVTLNEEWWAPSDNEWSTQHDFFKDPSPITGIDFYTPNNKIIVIKSCFPSSSITSIGQASDTLNPTDKTIYNYKWHWRNIVNVMKVHPSNFFVIWTNAPLEINSTNLSEAGFSDIFCKWAKDTLAQGLDSEFGAFPSNVYVFDFFHKITDAMGVELPQYASGPGDSHPNAVATELVAPQFVQEVFNASIYYETIYSQIVEPSTQNLNFKVYPNFSSDYIIIKLQSLSNKNNATLYNSQGNIILSQKIINYNTQISIANLASGVYYLKLSNEKMVEVRKVIKK
ncbi:MAG: hypothetical protein A2X08_06910 [Bacteroidetes bacterium GWA2_32_17]|nr:MAG: hypothetical protein A2X08_06910 [Bacteroidetes bacterium GWA2_32_17]